MSAAAFAKRLLDLEGELTPNLVSLVSKGSSMLDGLQDGTIDINEAKARLHDIITSSKVPSSNEPVEFPWMVDGARVPKNAAQLLTILIMAIVEGIRSAGDSTAIDIVEQQVHHADTLSSMIAFLLGQPIAEPEVLNFVRRHMDQHS